MVSQYEGQEPVIEKVNSWLVKFRADAAQGYTRDWAKIYPEQRFSAEGADALASYDVDDVEHCIESFLFHKKCLAEMLVKAGAPEDVWLSLTKG